MAYIKTKEGYKIYYNYIKNNHNNTTLVFVHGFLANWTVFKKQINHFKKKYSVLYFDIRGHGKSTVPRKLEDYSLENIENDISLILKKEKIKKIILVGHSMGGMISLIFTINNPKMIKKLILIDTTYKNPIESSTIKYIKEKRKIIENLVDSLAKSLKTKKIKNKKEFDYSKIKKISDIPIIITSIIKSNFYTLVCSLDEMFSFDLKNKISKIKCPTLVIQGDKDILFSKNQAKHIAKLIKNSKLEILEGQHFVELENPIEVTEAIEKFIND